MEAFVSLAEKFGLTEITLIFGAALFHLVYFRVMNRRVKDKDKIIFMLERDNHAYRERYLKQWDEGSGFSGKRKKSKS